MSQFSKKNYDAFASILDSVGQEHTGLTARSVLETVAEKSANFFQADNERFDRERFLRASGIIA